eukprot:4375444-Prymnesium_polylepis.1
MSTRAEALEPDAARLRAYLAPTISSLIEAKVAADVTDQSPQGGGMAARPLAKVAESERAVAEGGRPGRRARGEAH